MCWSCRRRGSVSNKYQITQRPGFRHSEQPKSGKQTNMSGLQIPLNSVWSSMNYTPPRGSCNFKGGIMSGTCPCLRFMLHPVKVSDDTDVLFHSQISRNPCEKCSTAKTNTSQAATSFECDGCSHHASFHNLENPKEDEILQKWDNKQQAAILAAQQQTPASSAQRTKRKRIAERVPEQGFVVTDLTANEEDELLGSGGETSSIRATRGIAANNPLRSARKAPTGR